MLTTLIILAMTVGCASHFTQSASQQAHSDKTGPAKRVLHLAPGRQPWHSISSYPRAHDIAALHTYRNPSPKQTTTTEAYHPDTPDQGKAEQKLFDAIYEILKKGKQNVMINVPEQPTEKLEGWKAEVE